MEDIKGMADELSKTMLNSKSEIMDMQSQILTFPTITKATFKTTAQAIADIATQTNHGLSETAIMAGKALANPAEGLNAMRRYGVMFDDTHRKNKLNI